MNKAPLPDTLEVTNAKPGLGKMFLENIECVRRLSEFDKNWIGSISQVLKNCLNGTTFQRVYSRLLSKPYVDYATYNSDIICDILPL